MFDHNWSVFHSRGGGGGGGGGIYPFLLIPDTYFLYHFIQSCDLVEVVPFTKPTQSNIKHSVDLPTVHSHPFNAMSPCRCNAICHCMLYHVTCIMNATWTTQSTPLIRCQGQPHHLHMTSIHHFIHVNISYKHILTFNFNISFYYQEMTHTQASHVMAIAHNNSSHVNRKEHTY